MLAAGGSGGTRFRMCLALGVGLKSSGTWEASVVSGVAVVVPGQLSKSGSERGGLPQALAS